MVARTAEDAMSVQSNKSRRGKGFGWFRRRKNDQTPKTSNRSKTGAKVVEHGPRVPNLTSPTQQRGILKQNGVNRDPPIPKHVGKSSKKSVKTSKASWFCRTEHFEKMCDAAFEEIDSDKSGNVDETELYSGLLLIHLKLGCYAGPAACRPLSRERCSTVFQKFDEDASKSLDRKEFHSVMAVLFGNVVLRVLVQWAMTLMIVPLVAQAIYDAGIWLFHQGVVAVQSLDEHSDVANSIELTLEGAASWCAENSPGKLRELGSVASEYVAMVPDSVWSAIPLTLISTVLGIAVVPWCIFKVDDFFQYIADRKSKKKIK